MYPFVNIFYSAGIVALGIFGYRLSLLIESGTQVLDSALEPCMHGTQFIGESCDCTDTPFVGKFCSDCNCTNGGACKVTSITTPMSGLYGCACPNRRFGTMCDECNAGGILCNESCFENFYGDRCNTFCTNTSTCAGHGECDHRSGTCNCDEGWYDGEISCERPCPRTNDGICDNHGQCYIPANPTSQLSCVCDSGWVGDKCELPCPGGMTCTDGNGVCSVLDGVAVCTCNDGFKGEGCSKICPGNLRCSGHGTCKEQNGEAVCECSGGYKGIACTCSQESCGVGTCDEDINTGEATCTCNGNYEGLKCDTCKESFYGDECTKQCNDDNCKYGTCTTDGNCKCWTYQNTRQDWSGIECDRCSPNYYPLATQPPASKECYLFRNANYCGQYGTVQHDGTCLCQGQFTGNFCDRCKTNYFGPLCTVYCDATTCGPGTCNEEATDARPCSCPKGKYGMYCQLGCFSVNGEECNGHGECNQFEHAWWDNDGTLVANLLPPQCSCTSREDDTLDLFYGERCDVKCPRANNQQCNADINVCLVLTYEEVGGIQTSCKRDDECKWWEQQADAGIRIGRDDFCDFMPSQLQEDPSCRLVWKTTMLKYCNSLVQSTICLFKFELPGMEGCVIDAPQPGSGLGDECDGGLSGIDVSTPRQDIDEIAEECWEQTNPQFDCSNVPQTTQVPLARELNGQTISVWLSETDPVPVQIQQLQPAGEYDVITIDAWDKLDTKYKPFYVRNCLGFGRSKNAYFTDWKAAYRYARDTDCYLDIYADFYFGNPINAADVFDTCDDYNLYQNCIDQATSLPATTNMSQTIIDTQPVRLDFDITECGAANGCIIGLDTLFVVDVDNNQIQIDYNNSDLVTIPRTTGMNAIQFLFNLVAKSVVIVTMETYGKLDNLDSVDIKINSRNITYDNIDVELPQQWTLSTRVPTRIVYSNDCNPSFVRLQENVKVNEIMTECAILNNWNQDYKNALGYCQKLETYPTCTSSLTEDNKDKCMQFYRRFSTVECTKTAITISRDNWLEHDRNKTRMIGETVVWNKECQTPTDIVASDIVPGECAANWLQVDWEHQCKHTLLGNGSCSRLSCNCKEVGTTGPSCSLSCRVDRFSSPCGEASGNGMCEVDQSSSKMPMAGQAAIGICDCTSGGDKMNACEPSCEEVDCHKEEYFFTSCNVNNASECINITGATSYCSGQETCTALPSFTFFEQYKGLVSGKEVDFERKTRQKVDTLKQLKKINEDDFWPILRYQGQALFSTFLGTPLQKWRNNPENFDCQYNKCDAWDVDTAMLFGASVTRMGPLTNKLCPGMTDRQLPCNERGACDAITEYCTCVRARTDMLGNIIHGTEPLTDESLSGYRGIDCGMVCPGYNEKTHSLENVCFGHGTCVVRDINGKTEIGCNCEIGWVDSDGGPCTLQAPFNNETNQYCSNRPSSIMITETLERNQLYFEYGRQKLLEDVAEKNLAGLGPSKGFATLNFYYDYEKIDYKNFNISDGLLRQRNNIMYLTELFSVVEGFEEVIGLQCGNLTNISATNCRCSDCLCYSVVELQCYQAKSSREFVVNNMAVASFNFETNPSEKYTPTNLNECTPGQVNAYYDITSTSAPVVQVAICDGCEDDLHKFAGTDCSFCKKHWGGGPNCNSEDAQLSRNKCNAYQGCVWLYGECKFDNMGIQELKCTQECPRDSSGQICSGNGQCQWGTLLKPSCLCGQTELHTMMPSNNNFYIWERDVLYNQATFRSTSVVATKVYNYADNTCSSCREGYVGTDCIFVCNFCLFNGQCDNNAMSGVNPCVNCGLNNNDKLNPQEGCLAYGFHLSDPLPKQTGRRRLTTNIVQDVMNYMKEAIHAETIHLFATEFSKCVWGRQPEGIKERECGGSGVPEVFSKVTTLFHKDVFPQECSDALTGLDVHPIVFEGNVFCVRPISDTSVTPMHDICRLTEDNQNIMVDGHLVLPCNNIPDTTYFDVEVGTTCKSKQNDQDILTLPYAQLDITKIPDDIRNRRIDFVEFYEHTTKSTLDYQLVEEWEASGEFGNNNQYSLRDRSLLNSVAFLDNHRSIEIFGHVEGRSIPTFEDCYFVATAMSFEPVYGISGISKGELVTANNLFGQICNIDIETNRFWWGNDVREPNITLQLPYLNYTLFFQATQKRTDCPPDELQVRSSLRYHWTKEITPISRIDCMRGGGVLDFLPIFMSNTVLVNFPSIFYHEQLELGTCTHTNPPLVLDHNAFNMTVLLCDQNYLAMEPLAHADCDVNGGSGVKVQQIVSATYDNCLDCMEIPCQAAEGDVFLVLENNENYNSNYDYDFLLSVYTNNKGVVNNLKCFIPIAFT